MTPEDMADVARLIYEGDTTELAGLAPDLFAEIQRMSDVLARIARVVNNPQVDDFNARAYVRAAVEQ